MVTPKILTFEQAIREAGSEKKPHLLLGNGFSRALKDDIFAYDALFNRADFKGLSAEAQKAFSTLGTSDFEKVMRALRESAKLVNLYEPVNQKLAKRMNDDAEGLREVLVKAIAGSHPELPSEVLDKAYLSCKKFLAHFELIYTLNYDLLLYWTLMHKELQPEIPCDDGFRTPDAGSADYVTWEVENTNQQNIFYLHGGLHLFDSGDEVQKYTWINTGIRLIEQVRAALKRGLFPLFVAEGTSSQKLERISHSGYLSRGYRSFANIGGVLFVFGHAMGPSDDHVIRLIEKGKVSRLFVGIFGDQKSKGNQQIITRCLGFPAKRHKKRPLEVNFFDSSTAAVWG